MQQLDSMQALPPRNIPLSISIEQLGSGFLSPNTDEKHENFSFEVIQRFTGPMPARKFVLTFLRSDSPCDDRMPSDYTVLKDVFSSSSASVKEDILDILCKYFNGPGQCPGFKLSRPADRSGNDSHPNPDLCLYHEKAHEKAGGVETLLLGLSELFVQVRVDEVREDPFEDPTPETDFSNFNFDRDIYEELENEGERNREDDIEDPYMKNRAEIAIYAAELCARQFRTHCFSISIYGTKVRFFRWDRAGVIISRSFDILENPELLCLFMWRYANATVSQRGYDTSVTRASHEEEGIFVKIVRNHIKEQLSIEDSELDVLVKEHYEPNSVFKMSIHPRVSSELDSSRTSPEVSISKPYPWDELWHEDNEANRIGDTNEINGISSKSRCYTGVQYFLVSRPVVAPLDIACRGTRGYWAVKIPDENIVETEYVIAFVKDTWREDSENADIEGDVIVGNIEAGVKFISDVYCHGDVKTSSGADNTEFSDDGPKNGHVTWAGKYKFKAKWNCNKNKNKVPLLRHYRMASVEVGYPLSTLRGTKELVHGVRCAFLAAWAAYVLRRRLHRDISLNNIILVKKGNKWRTGILIDWELGSIVAEDGKAKDIARAGTWSFMSIALLRGKDFKHRLEDDMESVYYVLFLACILYLPRVEVKDFEKLVSSFFDEHMDMGETSQGGTFKIANVVAGLFEKNWQFHDKLVQKCLDEMIELQRPFQDQPEWTPQAFSAILESADKKDLPFDDRTDHCRIKQEKAARRRALLDLEYDLKYGTASSEKSVPSLTKRAETPTITGKSVALRKRSMDEAELEDCVEPTKRPAAPSLLNHDGSKRKQRKI